MLRAGRSSASTTSSTSSGSWGRSTRAWKAPAAPTLSMTTESLGANPRASGHEGSEVLGGAARSRWGAGCRSGHAHACRGSWRGHFPRTESHACGRRRSTRARRGSLWTARRPATMRAMTWMSPVRATASILHLDLDAFFAAVEQRDKPSLRGKPVIVGGVGRPRRGATASYEARAFGVRSAMSTREARARCPHAAFLTGRFHAYRETSSEVMAVLRDASPARRAALARRGVRRPRGRRPARPRRRRP